MRKRSKKVDKMKRISELEEFSNQNIFRSLHFQLLVSSTKLIQMSVKLLYKKQCIEKYNEFPKKGMTASMIRATEKRSKAIKGCWKEEEAGTSGSSNDADDDTDIEKEHKVELWKKFLKLYNKRARELIDNMKLFEQKIRVIYWESPQRNKNNN